MTRTAEEIASLFRQRRNEAGPMRAKAAEIAQVYDGMVQVPLPELDQSTGPAVANWLSQGLDQMAMRVASVTPAIICPPSRPGFTGAEDKAKVRRRAMTAWWQENHFDLQMSKRARWFIGYASAPVVMRPDSKRGIPVWELRDPLSCYPAPNPDPVGILPDDCIFAVKRRYDWVAAHFPAAARALVAASTPNPDLMFECLEYTDDDEHVLIALGNSQAQSQPTGPWHKMPSKATSTTPEFVELMRFPNRVGRCPVVIPRRTSLNQPHGQFDQMPGLYRMQAKAMALWLVATQRAIFPDTWFISRPNEQVTVLKVPDGVSGVPGEVKGGDLKEVSPVSAPQVAQLLEMLESNQMKTAGVSSQFGGEQPSNVRTGRAGADLLSQTVDFWVQEAQRTIGAALQEENKLAVAIAKEYFGDKPTSIYVSFGKVNGAASYTPNKDFDSDANIVAWPHAGADVNSLVIGIGQRLGLGEISKRTARQLDPYVDDPDLEEDRCTAESMEQALLAAINQAILSGQIGPLEVGQMVQLVSEEKQTIYEAFNTVHERIQAMAQQAQQAATAASGPGGMGGGQPGLPPGPGAGGGGAPPGAPGLMAPGVAAQVGLGPGNPPGGGVPAPTPGVAHMGSLMSALRPRQV